MEAAAAGAEKERRAAEVEEETKSMYNPRRQVRQLRRRRPLATRVSEEKVQTRKKNLIQKQAHKKGKYRNDVRFRG